MPGAKIPPPLRFAGWPGGVRNRGREESSPLSEMGTQTALRAARNVDLDDAGKPQRRPGRTNLSTTATHSLWAFSRFPYMLAVQEGQLVSIEPDGSAIELAALAAPARARMAFAFGADSAYGTNGHDTLIVSPNGVAGPWATECPEGQPVADVLAGAGGLAAGTYQVAITHVDGDGRESGATLPVEVEVADDGGIRLTGFPVPQTDGPVWTRVYCSKPNGDTLYFVGSMPTGSAAYVIGAHESGAALDKLFLSALPAGQTVAFHAGRLYVGIENLLVWGEAMMHGLTNLTRNWMRYDTDVIQIAPVGQAESSGLFVSVAAGSGRAAGRTYFLAGPDPKKAPRVVALPQGAVAGSLTYVDSKALGYDTRGDLPVWVTDDGQLAAGMPNGQIELLHEKNYVGPTQLSAASLAVREHNGLQHLVASLRGGMVNKMATTDTADAEVWRAGVRVTS